MIFLGARPTGSTAYTTTPTALANLKKLLIEFFGAALGCSDTTIAAYTGRNLTTIHQVYYYFFLIYFLSFVLIDCVYSLSLLPQ